jgi:hypothetical protein
MVSLKVVHPLKIYQNTKCHGSTLTRASFTSTSKVRTSAILEWLKLRHQKLWHRGLFQWHDFPTEFHKNLPFSSEVDRGGQTDRQDGDVISLLLL